MAATRLTFYAIHSIRLLVPSLRSLTSRVLDPLTDMNDSLLPIEICEHIIDSCRPWHSYWSLRRQSYGTWHQTALVCSAWLPRSRINLLYEVVLSDASDIDLLLRTLRLTPLDAGVISSDGPIVLSPDDADRVADLLAAPPAPTEAMRALFAARQPCAGWVDVSLAIRKQHTSWTDPRIAVWQLPDADCDVLAEVRTWIDDDANSIARWSLDNDRYGNAPTIDAAKLAAEDALLAVADAIRRAVGR